MTAWQPISTAPKDGTWILAIIAGFWEMNIPYIPDVVSWNDESGGWNFCEEEGEIDKDWKPTHWMPLPEPPKDTP